MNGPCLRTKPKFIRLHQMLGVSPQTARGLLEFLWDSVLDTGDPVIGDADAIEAAAGWTGEPGKLCRALLDCGGNGKFGFIEEVAGQPGLYQLHDLMQHTPADLQRKWIRQQERLERGMTLAEIRRAAANARWNKKGAAKPQAANADANSDAKSCKTMQMDAVCMPAATCAKANDGCQAAVAAEPAAVAVPAIDEAQPEPPADFKVPRYAEVYDYFKAMAFYGDVNEFIKRYQAALKDPNSRAARRGWPSEAQRYACEIQAQWARENANTDDMLRIGGKKLKAR